jgi:hypothetical protein
LANKTIAPDQSGQEPELVWVTLTQTHDLPGMKLRPGRARVSTQLREELKAAGKLAE